MSREDHERLGTADLVAGSEHREVHADETRRPPPQDNAMRPDPRQAAAGAQAQPLPQEPRPVQHGEQPLPGAALHAQPDQRAQGDMKHGAASEQLAALFPPQMADDFRHRWDQVQIGFVDDPRRAVQQADELVAQVMKSLAASFADQRKRLEAGLGQDTQADTEDLRMALRSYRSFFQRLLSL